MSLIGVRWFDNVKNAEITRRTGLFHIGEIIQRHRHSLLGHIARMDSLTPAHMALKLCRDTSMGRRVPVGWRKPRGALAQHGPTSRLSAERHGQAGVNVVNSGAGPLAVGTGPYGPEGLCGMRRARGYS